MAPIAMPSRSNGTATIVGSRAPSVPGSRNSLGSDLGQILDVHGSRLDGPRRPGHGAMAG